MALRIVRQEHSLPTPIRAAIYARVSTLNAGQDPTMQTRELQEYCQRRGWAVHDVYIDNGVSGKKDSRPRLNRMMQDAHERRFDAVGEQSVVISHGADFHVPNDIRSQLNCHYCGERQQ